MFKNIKFARFKFRNNSRARKEFYEDFAQALKDGESPGVRLEKLISRSKRDSDSLSILYEHWVRRMRRTTFAQSLNHSIPSYEVMVLTSAERDGRLAEAMTYLSQSLTLLGKIKSAYMMSLFSPAISFLVIIGMLFANALEISPNFLQLIPFKDWPFLPKIIHSFSTFLVTYWYFALSALIGVFYIVGWSKENWIGRFRKKAEEIPGLPWMTHRIRQGDSFLITLALMLQSNSTGLKEALVLMKEFASPWMRWHINQMLKRLALTPNEPARALDTGFFQRNVMNRIEDFAERSNFEEGLKKMAIDNGDYTLEKANRNAVLASLIAILISGAFMMTFSVSQKQLGDAMQTSLTRNR